MPQGLGIQLGLGGGRSATPSGAPAGGTTPFTNEYSVDFDGAGGAVGDQLNVDLTGLSDITAATFSIWYKKEAVSTYANAFGAGTSSPAIDLIGLDIGTSALRFWVYQTTSPVGATLVTYTITDDGAWHHLVGVYDASITNKLTLYFDGLPKVTGTAGPTALNASAVAGGGIGLFYGTGYPFGGLLDEAAVWDSALTEGDVVAIYNDGTPVGLGTDGLNLSPVGWWSMGDTGSDSGSGACQAVSTITNAVEGGVPAEQPNSTKQPLISLTVPTA